MEWLTAQKLSLTAALGAPAQTVVLLHGFGGSARTWDAVARACETRGRPALALDLPGHGASIGMPVSFGACVEHVLAAAPPHFVLCGYSLGGRIALQVALAAPSRVTGLVLVSTTAGIEDPSERARRRDEDEALAAQAEAADFDRFIEQWRARPAFSGDDPTARDAAAAEQRRNGPLALAAALRALGTGAMEPLWGRLPELRMPATVVVGDRDAKFSALGRRLAEGLSAGSLVSVPGGHGLPWEAPEAIVAAIAAVA